MYSDLILIFLFVAPVKYPVVLGHAGLLKYTDDQSEEDLHLISKLMKETEQNVKLPPRNKNINLICRMRKHIRV